MGLSVPFLAADGADDPMLFAVGVEADVVEGLFMEGTDGVIEAVVHGNNLLEWEIYYMCRD